MSYRVVYPKVTVEKPVNGKFKTVDAPAGEGHLFREVRNEQGKLELEGMSLCKRAQWDIGHGSIVVLKTALPELPICPECSRKWKADPNGPWARWSKVASG